MIFIFFMNTSESFSVENANSESNSNGKMKLLLSVKWKKQKYRDVFFSLIHLGRSSVMFVLWIVMILITKTAFLGLFTSDDAKKKTKKKTYFQLLSCIPLSIQMAVKIWHEQHGSMAPSCFVWVNGLGWLCWCVIFWTL